MTFIVCAHAEESEKSVGAAAVYSREMSCSREECLLQTEQPRSDIHSDSKYMHYPVSVSSSLLTSHFGVYSYAPVTPLSQWPILRSQSILTPFASCGGRPRGWVKPPPPGLAFGGGAFLKTPRSFFLLIEVEEAFGFGAARFLLLAANGNLFFLAAAAPSSSSAVSVGGSSRSGGARGPRASPASAWSRRPPRRLRRRR